jgi:hypothetical protein
MYPEFNPSERFNGGGSSSVATPPAIVPIPTLKMSKIAEKKTAAFDGDKVGNLY